MYKIEFGGNWEGFLLGSLRRKTVSSRIVAFSVVGRNVYRGGGYFHLVFLAAVNDMEAQRGPR